MCMIIDITTNYNRVKINCIALQIWEKTTTNENILK